MAQHKSAEKRSRSNAKKSNRNGIFMSSVKTAVKQFRTAFEKGEETKLLSQKYTKAQTLLAKAASKGIMHKNAASRKISNLTALLKKKVQ